MTHFQPCFARFKAKQGSFCGTSFALEKADLLKVQEREIEGKFMALALLQKDFLRSVGKGRKNILNRDVFGDKVGLIASLFGCWHKNLTRPFGNGKTSYRACLDCGARKPFDSETLQTEKRFYYPPIVKNIRVE
jgi:hypothetical protein